MFDKRGQAQDGVLRLHDIYSLRLPAELVVLSACNTALGKPVRGEGLVGIVRGFMYAGAKRVVASHWKVDDEATGELMGRFYGEMLNRMLPRPPRSARRSLRCATGQVAGSLLLGRFRAAGRVEMISLRRVAPRSETRGAADRRLRIFCADVSHHPADTDGIILGGITYEIYRHLSSPGG